MGSNKNFVESSKADLSNIAALVSLGTVGKTRRERMDELNAKLKKAEAKRSKEIMSRKIPAGQYPKGGGKGLKINPKMVTPGSGGSTSSAYTVKRGDTLSAIAKTSGVKLSELLAANTKFKTDAKYKGGSMIWAGTKVKLPKK
jgi:LysM repeat protein